MLEISKDQNGKQCGSRSGPTLFAKESVLVCRAKRAKYVVKEHFGNSEKWLLLGGGGRVAVVERCIAPDKREYPCNIFSYFLTQTYIVGTH